MKHMVPYTIHNRQNFVTVDYGAMTNPRDAAFDVLNLPFSPDACRGYPMLHAYFEKLNLTGYERYCGWIQIIRREEFDNLTDLSPARIHYELDVPEDLRARGCPYFAIGYPPELFDAPCRNLRNSQKVIWKAYTFLVDIPSRINRYQLSCLAGFSWGYTENILGDVSLLEFRILPESEWNDLKARVGLDC